MEFIIKVSVLCIIVVILALVVGQKLPQFSVCLVLISTVIIIGMCVDYIDDILKNIADLVENSGINMVVFQPVIKVCGISVISKITGDICTDAGFSAISQKIKLASSITCIITILPLFEMILEILKDIL